LYENGLDELYESNFGIENQDPFLFSGSERVRFFTNDRFFLFSLASTLLLNVIAVTLTWLVVFSWNAGFEYNPNSFWQLASYGPFVTLGVTQLTLTGVFVMIKVGFSSIAKSKLNQVLNSFGSGGSMVDSSEAKKKLHLYEQRYSRLTKIVLSIILAIIAMDAMNDVSGILVLFHVL
jgi:hypothetical protein